MREEIEAEGGTVEKFIGDAVMAAFGVPAAHEDDPARALRAALRMRERLPSQPGLERFDIDAADPDGREHRRSPRRDQPAAGDPMVTGDAVNVAARLEQSADPGQILVAERTARAARGFRFRELGAQELRGKEQPVPPSCSRGGRRRRPNVVCRGFAPRWSAATGARTPRAASIERSAGEGRPNLVTIYGDPGVGKSRLVAEFVGWAEGRSRPEDPPRPVPAHTATASRTGRSPRS